VCIRNGAPNINAIFQNTVWREQGWQRALRALDDAIKPGNPIRFSGKDKSRAVGIPSTYFSDDQPIQRQGRSDRGDRPAY
jgi:hypothetical protein